MNKDRFMATLVNVAQLVLWGEVEGADRQKGNVFLRSLPSILFWCGFIYLLGKTPRSVQFVGVMMMAVVYGFRLVRTFKGRGFLREIAALCFSFDNS